MKYPSQAELDAYRTRNAEGKPCRIECTPYYWPLGDAPPILGKPGNEYAVVVCRLRRGNLEFKDFTNQWTQDPKWALALDDAAGFPSEWLSGGVLRRVAATPIETDCWTVEPEALENVSSIT